VTSVHRIDYLSEREACAIRCNAFAGGEWRENIADMTIEFRDSSGWVPVDRFSVARFMDDWRRCGAWSLHGRDHHLEEQIVSEENVTDSPLNLEAFDAAAYLTDPDDQASLIADAFADGTPELIDRTLAMVVRARDLSKGAD
jgi:hypothetical protein